MKNLNRYPFIFTGKANEKTQSIPFYVHDNHVGETKYLPAVSKQWKNNVYSYDSRNNINYPFYNMSINSLIKGYFSLFFKHKFLGTKYISPRKKRKSLNKIFASNAEIKHTNNKAIVTVYVYNRERRVLMKKIKKLERHLITFPSLWLRHMKKTEMSVAEIELMQNYILNRSLFNLDNFSKDMLSKYKKLYIVKRNLKRFKLYLSTLRRLRLKLGLNKLKLGNKFLFRLTNSISKYYNKKVVLNIVNLKFIASNSDIFTEILTLKIKNSKVDPLAKMRSLLARVVLPEVNSVIERGRIEKQVDFSLIPNKYPSLNVHSIIKEKSLNDRLDNLLYNTFKEKNISEQNKYVVKETPKVSISHENYFSKIREIIFNDIKYKCMAGARLIVKGRLTKRYRADRALYKFSWKGGLKNIDSAFKGLSSVVFRGYLDSNVEKSRFFSKRRIGAFGVRTWLSGK
jgi:hypothetical protein